MRNLAGVPNPKVTEAARAELEAAKVPAIPVRLERSREVMAEVVGGLLYQKAAVGFERAWYYWIVRASKPLPERYALALNEVWSTEVRFAGTAGGRSNILVKADYLEMEVDDLMAWHVDTPSGLAALVETFDRAWGKRESFWGLEVALLRGNDLISEDIKAPPRPRREGGGDV